MHSRIIVLAKRKLTSIETLISQALIDLEIIHGKCKEIVNERDKYAEMKENIWNKKSNDELSENGRNNKKNSENV